MKNFDDAIGNGTPDLPSCSAVPQQLCQLVPLSFYKGGVQIAGSQVVGATNYAAPNICGSSESSLL